MKAVRGERLAPWVIGLTMACPILVFRYPPMGDLAMHEALVAIMRHGTDASWAPPGLYFVVAPQANQLFHWLVYALSFVVPTDLACKLVVAMSVALAAPAMSALLHHLHLSRWPSLLVTPILCGWIFRWGLAANMLSLPILLVSMPLLERVARRPSASRVALSFGAACLIFFAHESSAFVFALAAVYFGLTRATTIGSAVTRTSTALVVLALAVAQWSVSHRLAGANMRAIGNDYGDDPLARLSMLPSGIFGGLGTWRLALIGGLSVVAHGASAWGRHTAILEGLPVRVLLWRYRYLVLSVTLFFFFFGFPMSLGGTTLLAHRFIAPACAFLIVACARPVTRPLAVAAATLVPLVMVALTIQTFRQVGREYRDLDEVLAQLPDDVSVAQLDLSPPTGGRAAPVPGAASRALAVHGGRMLFALTDMPPNPVFMPLAVQWNEPLLRLRFAPFAFMPTHDATRFAYLLVENHAAAFRALVRQALAPEERLVASAGVWDLYRSTLKVAPLDAPDEPLPTPAPETLADRVGRLLAASRESHEGGSH